MDRVEHDPLCGATHRQPEWCGECEFIEIIREAEREKINGTTSD